MTMIAALFLAGAVATFCGVGAAIAYGQRQSASLIRTRDGRVADLRRSAPSSTPTGVDPGALADRSTA